MTPGISSPYPDPRTRIDRGGRGDWLVREVVETTTGVQVQQHRFGGPDAEAQAHAFAEGRS